MTTFVHDDTIGLAAIAATRRIHTGDQGAAVALMADPADALAGSLWLNSLLASALADQLGITVPELLDTLHARYLAAMVSHPDGFPETVPG